MRRELVVMLGAVALAATAFPAFAQEPAAPEGYVLATPESMGVSPEVFARLNIPAGSYVKAGGPSRYSDGYATYLPPVTLDRPSNGAVPIVPDAIAHRATARVDKQRWRAASPIVIGAPFNIALPAGTRFGGSLDRQDGARPCFQPKPFATADTWLDENGDRFLLLCLHKPDAQGSYAVARLIPMDADKAQRRDIPIAPVRLDPIPAGTTDPYFSPIVGVRQLRIVAVASDRATIALEVGAIMVSEEEGEREPVEAVHNYRIVTQVELPLKPGAQVTIAGVTLTAQRAGKGWALLESGSFGDWAGISSDGSAVRVGELTFEPRNR